MIHDYIVMFEELFSERGLSLERLKTFCEIAHAGGVTRAAKGPVRQSQFSRQVRELEAFVGTDLFIRKRNSFRPTPAGEKLLSVAKDFMIALALARREIKSLPQTMRVGAGESVFNWLLFPRLSRLNQLFPNYQFDFRNLRSKEVVRGLLESEIDFGIVREDACPKELKQRRIGVMTYCLFLPAEMARSMPSSRDEILNHVPLATLEGDGKFKTELLERSAKAGIKLDLRVICSSFPLMTEVLKQGEHAAILPNIAEVELPSSRFRRIDLKFLKPMERHHVLCYRQRTLDRRNALCRELNSFVDLLKIQKGCGR